MDGEEMKNSAVDSGALAKAALAAVMAKPPVAATAVSAEMLSLQAELAALKATLGPKAKPTVKAAKPVSKATGSASSMTFEEAKKYVAKFTGKKGRRPADFYEAQKILGSSTETIAPAKVKAVKPAKVKAAIQSKPVADSTAVMTVEQAQKFVASFNGKKGRRPAAFYAAQKIAGNSTETIAPAKTDKAVAKEAKAAAKLAAKEAKLAAKATKVSKPIKEVSGKKTGQGGAVIKDLTADDLNEKERALILAFGTEGHRTDKSIKDLAAVCFPHKKTAQANSWARNALRRLVRAKLVEKDARGVFKQSVEGRNVAKKLGDVKELVK